MKTAYAPRLELRQGQALVMTQALQQSIKLLQLNAIELQAFVDLELEKNPFLEAAQEEPEGEETPKPAESEEPREADFSGDATFEDDSADIERDYLEPFKPAHSAASQEGDDEYNVIENAAAHEKTLREHLLEQLSVDIADPAERLIGAYLIDLVDDAGYITEDLSVCAEKLGAEPADIEAVLTKIQRFDPPGIAARSLKECLALQLKEQGRLDPAMACLLDHLPLLAEAKYDELARLCGVDKDDMRDMVREIRALNPKPGSAFLQDTAQAIEPDAFVRRLSSGDWRVELNMSHFPKVMVNKRYYKEVSKQTRNVKDKEYVGAQFGTANWLLRALEQRAETTLKVTSELVKQQDAFFRLGVRFLKPMTLKDIAVATGYHESTISRVTSGKFLICPRGTFELKYFFTSALSRAHGGEDVSSAAVKHHIAELIKTESPECILSDDDIVERLKDKNIEVARRTVAKYREALGIPSSPKRKRLLANML